MVSTQPQITTANYMKGSKDNVTEIGFIYSFHWWIPDLISFPIVRGVKSKVLESLR